MSAHYDSNLEHPSPEALDNILIISARGGYSMEAHKDLGYNVLPPFRDTTLIGRIVREAWFRLPLHNSPLYTPITSDPTCIIVHDPQITREYLQWLQQQFPSAKINYLYWNLVGKARHLTPDKLPKGIIAWTYDERDARTYGINLLDSLGFPTMYAKSNQRADFDLVFVGADKGRAEFLFELQRDLEGLGLSTDFHITADGRFSKRRSFYSKRMPYSEVLDLISRSRAILNVCDSRQLGATLRDYESIFTKTKLVTNNHNARNFRFYKPENVFILGEQPLSDLPYFLQTPFSPIDEVILQSCTLNAHLNQIYNAS